MQCRSVEMRIQNLLDDRRNPAFDSELIEHASTCPECHDLLDAQGELMGGMPLEIPRLSADFSQRVVGLVVTDRKRSARRFAPAAAFLAIVATLALVAALGPPRKSMGPAVDTDAIASVAMIDGSTTDGSMTDVSVTGFDTHEVGIVLVQFVERLTKGDGARFYQVDQLAGTIRPLATTLNVAFDAIRRSIPSRRQPVRSEPQARDHVNSWALYVI